MEPSRPSLTAIGVARRRAAHQLFDAPVVFADPLAVAILGADAEARLRAEAHKHYERFSVALRAFVVARARAAEEQLQDAVARGVSSKWTTLRRKLGSVRHWRTPGSRSPRV